MPPFNADTRHVPSTSPDRCSTTKRTLQIAADMFVVCWVVLCVWLGRAVSSGISSLRGPRAAEAG
jgi:hypothetical protein